MWRTKSRFAEADTDVARWSNPQSLLVSGTKTLDHSTFAQSFSSPNETLLIHVVMSTNTAFLSPATFSSHSRSIRSGISHRSSAKLRIYVRPTCTAKPPPETSPQQDAVEDVIPDSQPSKNPVAAFFQSLRVRRQTLASYGVAALISYGLFDAVTYSVSFLLSLRAYIAAGKILTWRTLPQVLAVMWGINNLSRPFRVAGALALAPVVDRRIVQPIRSFLSKKSGDK